MFRVWRWAVVVRVVWVLGVNKGARGARDLPGMYIKGFIIDGDLLRGGSLDPERKI